MRTGRWIMALTAAVAACVLAGCGTDSAGVSLTGKKEIREFTAFYATAGTEIDDDNEIQQRIAALTGVRVKETWLTGQTAAEAVGTFIAGAEYPDFIHGGDATAQLYEAGALIPLDEYLDAYPNLKNYWSEDEWNRVRQADGHIYWIPQFGNVYLKDMGTTPTEAFWIQTRVLKWAGYPRIKTLDEYFELLEEYNAANPTMEDGSANIPFTILCDGSRYFCLENLPQFLAGYPNDGSVIVEPSTGKVVDYNTIPEAEIYFAKLNEEYHKGIVDPESFTQTYEEYIAKLSGGHVLGMVDQWWQFAMARESLKQQGMDRQGCNYVPLALTIDADVTPDYNTVSVVDASRGISISVSCQDPEGALQFLNDLLEPEVRILRSWGIEGEDYEVGADGMFYRTDEQWAQASDSAYVAAHMCSYSYLPNYMGMLPDGINASDPVEQPAELLKSLPADVQECLRAYGCQTYLEMMDPADEPPGPWYPMWSYSGQLTTATAGGRAWYKMADVKHEYLPKVVMSPDFGKSWAEYMKAYEGTKVEDFLDEMQAYVDERLKTQ